MNEKIINDFENKGLSAHEISLKFNLDISKVNEILKVGVKRKKPLYIKQQEE